MRRVLKSGVQGCLNNEVFVVATDEAMSLF